jgi:hypothetical protein
VPDPDLGDREYLDSVIAQSKERLARIIDLEDALEATRNALHDACLKIGSTEGFRETFDAANLLLSDKQGE